MNDAMAEFVRQYATATIIASLIKYVTIACAILDVEAITHVPVTSLASTINAEVSIIACTAYRLQFT